MPLSEDPFITPEEVAQYHTQVVGELEARVEELTAVVDMLLALQAERADEREAVERALAECMDANKAALKDGPCDNGKRRRSTDRCAGVVR